MATKKTVNKARATTGRKGSTPADDMVEESIIDIQEEENANVGLAVYQDRPAMDPSDLFIPKLRLAQGLTAEVQSGEAKPGQWLVLGVEPMDEVNIIPVGMARRRELRDDDTRSVVCKSSDAQHGTGVPGGECALCPMAKWVEVTSGKNKGKTMPPSCSFIYSYMVYIVETETMAVLEFYRTSITAGKMLNTMIAQNGIGNFAVALTSTGRSGPKGTFYNPSISSSSVDKEEFEMARQKAGQVM